MGIFVRKFIYQSSDRVETSCSLFRLFRLIQDIEHRLGRTKNDSVATYSDRIIDIDILAYDDSDKYSQCAYLILKWKNAVLCWSHCAILPRNGFIRCCLNRHKLLEECPDNGRVLKIVVKS